MTLPAASASLERLRLAAFALLVALVVLGLAWELWLAPTGTGTLALKVTPLALALAGVWHGRLRTFRWLSLLVWLYVGEGLTRGPSEAAPGAHLAWLEVALGVSLFAACGAYVRLRLRLERARLAGRELAPAGPAAP